MRALLSGHTTLVRYKLGKPQFLINMIMPKGVALITGSTQGIGRSIALRLAKDGFDIALNDVTTKHKQLTAVATEIEGLGRKTCIVPADVSEEDQVKHMVDSSVERLGGLDVMVANAGVLQVSPFLSTSVDNWDRTLRINARGVFLCYQFAAARMVKQGRGGRIIGASSGAGKIGLPGGTAYSASKFAVRGLTQSTAVELGKYGITVNSYAPGSIMTPMTKTSSRVRRSICMDEAHKEIQTYITQLVENRPLKHEGQPEDIASIVSYLASKEAHFITGQSISVDGGIVFS
ncbi:short chain oxidoreductase [Rhizopogon salebrosus TDB-379]|nr:short chain oxidoreductase [Rhizopogon salebrosus TDB-379]